MILLKLLMLILAAKSCFSEVDPRIFTGYPVGFLSNCPGTTKEARISPKSLSRLTFILVHDVDVLKAFRNQTAFNYHKMHELGKHLDFNKKTVVFVTGYFDSNFKTIGGSSMGTMYKKLGYNVLLLEYYAFNNMNYPRAVRFLRPVGKHAAEMLAELTKQGLDPRKLELVGLSHGGQAIGFIAKNYRELTGRNISRITPLDPSGPCFRYLGPEERVDASDADFVDVIHTNIDGYGMATPIGHVDFYVNGGEFQLGDFLDIPCDSFCSHFKSWQYWVAILANTTTFIGIQCDTVQDARDRNCFDRKPRVTNVMGLNVDREKQGIFYVMASNEYPYGLGQRGLFKKNEVYNTFLEKYNEANVVEL